MRQKQKRKVLGTTWRVFPEGGRQLCQRPSMSAGRQHWIQLPVCCWCDAGSMSRVDGGAEGVEAARSLGRGWDKTGQVTCPGRSHPGTLSMPRPQAPSGSVPHWPLSWPSPAT